MTYLGEKPNIGVITGILPGTDGVVKMSKSLGNHIPINTTAEDMYGKVMSIPDFAMPVYSRLVTRWTPPIIEKMESDLKAGNLHPRDAKMMLAKEIVGTFYGDDAAEHAQDVFIQTFQRGDVPDEMPEFHLEVGQSVLDVLVACGIVKGRSEGRRLVDQKGVKLDGKVLTEALAVFPHTGILQVGKRHFFKVM
jgi:tyrosyl-tRNA synthetase